MTQFTRYEQETIISFNVGEQSATVYTRDKAVMRKLDKLVEDFSVVYKLIEQTEHDKTYSMPKSHISYRKPRKISEEQWEQTRQKMIERNKEKFDI